MQCSVLLLLFREKNKRNTIIRTSDRLLLQKCLQIVKSVFLRLGQILHHSS